MPLVAFILLALVCVALLGFACACLSHQPTQALERALSSAAQTPAIVEIVPSSATASVLAVLSLWLLVVVERKSRASPAALQRFRF